MDLSPEVTAAIVGGIAGLVGSAVGSFLANHQRGDALAVKLHEEQIGAFRRIAAEVAPAELACFQNWDDRLAAGKTLLKAIQRERPVLSLAVWMAAAAYCALLVREHVPTDDELRTAQTELWDAMQREIRFDQGAKRNRDLLSKGDGIDRATGEAILRMRDRILGKQAPSPKPHA